MTLNENWKAILTKAWSVRFMALALVSTVLETIARSAPDLLPKTMQNAIIFSIATGVFTILAIFSRSVYQKNLNGDNK